LPTHWDFPEYFLLAVFRQHDVGNLRREHCGRNAPAYNVPAGGVFGDVHKDGPALMCRERIAEHESNRSNGKCVEWVGAISRRGIYNGPKQGELNLFTPHPALRATLSLRERNFPYFAAELLTVHNTCPSL